MQNYKELLFKKLERITRNVKGPVTLEDKINLIAYRKGNPENSFYICVSNFLINNTFKKGIKRYIDDISKLLYIVLKEKKYDNEFYLKYIKTNASDEFKKIMYISFFIGRNKNIPIYDVLRWILDKDEFEKFGKFQITEIPTQNSLINKILSNNIEDLENEVTHSQKNYKQFLYWSNEDFIKYFNQDDIEEDEQIKENDDTNNNANDFVQHNNNDNDNQHENNDENIIDIDEELNIINTINEEKEKNDEKIKRIKELISRTLSINDNKDFQDNTILDLNHKRISNIKEPIKMDDILIDNYDFNDESKYYLYSPISLLMNNKKTKFEKNDFEIFNRDNYYIELFGKLLELIIDKLNNYINEGLDYDFIKENKIKLGCYNNHFYLCCKLNKDFKNDYFANLKTNESLYKYDKQNVEVIKMETIDENKEKIPQKQSDKKNKGFTAFSSLKSNKDNYKRKCT